MTFAPPSTGSLMYAGSGLCQATTGSKRSSRLAHARDRPLSLGRVEVVEDALRHEEVGRGRAELVLQLGEVERRGEREVDVVPEQEVARIGVAVEEREPVATGLGRLDQLPVVIDVETAAH